MAREIKKKAKVVLSGEGADELFAGYGQIMRSASDYDHLVACSSGSDDLGLALEERGLLDRTLVVIASEFSRDMIIEGIPGSNAKDQSRAATERLGEMKHYGLHRHFTGGTSVVLFGGGTKKGFLYGKTADERPLIAVENPVNITDLHATIYRAMGISPKTAFDVERRPFYATIDGTGKAVSELFA